MEEIRHDDKVQYGGKKCRRNLEENFQDLYKVQLVAGISDSESVHLLNLNISIEWDTNFQFLLDFFLILQSNYPIFSVIFHIKCLHKPLLNICLIRARLCTIYTLCFLLLLKPSLCLLTFLVCSRYIPHWLFHCSVPKRQNLIHLSNHYCWRVTGLSTAG